MNSRTPWKGDMQRYPTELVYRLTRAVGRHGGGMNGVRGSFLGEGCRGRNGPAAQNSRVRIKTGLLERSPAS
jgi:hypothetical protein